MSLIADILFLPQKIIIGHQTIWQTLTRETLMGKPKHHAWLLLGQKGLGKATLLKKLSLEILSKTGQSEKIDMMPRTVMSTPPKIIHKPAIASSQLSLFGQDDNTALTASTSTQALTATNANPHQENYSLEIYQQQLAKQMSEGSHPNFYFIDKYSHNDGTKSQITVDAIRGINDFLNLASFDKDSMRIIIIDGIDDMNKSAANALLKNLEEPPNNCLFFLTAETLGRLPATIRSRCLLLPMKPLSEVEVIQILAIELPSLAPIEQKALAILARGRAGRALEIYRSAGLILYQDLLLFLQNPSSDMKKKIISSLVLKADSDKYELLISMLDELFHRIMLFHFQLQTSFQKIYDVEPIIFKDLLKMRPIDFWLLFWQEQKNFLLWGFPPKNLERNQLFRQLLDEWSQILSKT